MLLNLACFITLAIFTSTSTSAALISRQDRSWTVALNDRPIRALVTQNSNGAFSFDCQANEVTVISASNIGFSTSTGDIGPEFNSCTAQDQTYTVESYNTSGGRSQSHYAPYQTQTFNCKTSNGQSSSVDIRVGIDGCAFRVGFPDGQYTINSESLTWTFAKNGASFLMNDPENTSYEGEWEQSDAETGLQGSKNVMMPYLVDANSAVANQWILLEESAMDGSFQGSQLTHSSGSLAYQFKFAEGGSVKVDSSTFSPWRIAVVADLTNLYRTTFDADNLPSTNITDLSWIKPGTVSWSWLPEHNSPSNETRQMEYVDLAAELQWPYTLVDEGWDEAWVPDLVRYANNKGVDILLWYPANQWNSTDAVANNIANLNKWGVKGAKIDFFLSDVQAIHDQQTYILSQTAQAKLMVNFHGTPPPRGNQRTWPDLLSQEAIRGDENGGNAFRQTVIPFTRNLLGSMDFTPSLYTVSGGDTGSQQQQQQSAQCSVGCGLGKSIAFESAWQHIGETPEVIRSYNLAARFYKGLPSIWQASTVLPNSYPGKTFAVGRYNQPSDRYYFGGVFNGDAQTFELQPIILPNDKTFILDIVSDSNDDDNDRTGIIRTIVTDVTTTSTINLHVKSNGGFSAIACETAGSDGGCLAAL
ncbi:hypothetical protein L7F22_044268 [Adiantum nelumboides]|nr:hypothetical protein [Adiantum nelumboides]